VTSLARPPWAPEHLDETGHDPRLLAASLRDVERANRWFGGTRSLRRSLEPLLDSPALSILDVGTGSGEVLRTLVTWVERRNVRASAVGLDAGLDVIRVAAAGEGPPLVVGNACALPFADDAFDVVCATLLLHHVPDVLQGTALREMARVARRFVLVAELERHRLHYLGARFLAATLWRRNAITRHDGPVSVRRGYTGRELLDLATANGLRGRVERFFLYRLVLSVDVTARAAASSTV
jgi:SAM-dependent methyltransferase